MDRHATQVSRRAVLTYGTGAFSALFLASTGVLASAQRVAADVVNAQLFALNGKRIMIDGLVVPVLGFGSTPDRAEIPGGRLEVQTGDTVNLTLTNATNRQVGFAVPGVPGVPGDPVPPGLSRSISFTAPDRPGTFFYLGTIDGSAATGRALGATGALVVRPRENPTSIDANFPGALARARRQPLFGTQQATIPSQIVQERTWLFAELNPATARDLAGGQVALPNDPEPEYFLINGLSGMLAVEDPATFLQGRAGSSLTEPGDATLVRMINTGRAPRSLHFHGNHVWVLSHPDTPWIVGAFKDTVRVPENAVVDVLFPMSTPPDSFPVVDRAQKYPAHDHIEMAETASGGHYPSGMVSDAAFV